MVAKKIQAAVLSLTLLVPAEAAFAKTSRHRKATRSYVTHRHHHSRTRGALIGAAVGATVGHKKALKGALIGAALGQAVQYERNRQEKKKH